MTLISLAGVSSVLDMFHINGSDDAMTHSVRLFARLRAPGPMPAPALRLLIVLLLVCIVAIPLLAFLGDKFHDDPGEFFGEREVGTYLSAGFLIAAAVVTFRLHGAFKPLPHARTWLLFGFLFALTAADDLFQLHERLDRIVNSTFGFDPEGPADHLDDLFVALYGVAAGLLLFTRARIQILHFRWMCLLFVPAAGGFAAMVIMDWFNTGKAAEESAKIVACMLIVCAVAAASRSALADRLRRRAERAR